MRREVGVIVTIAILFASGIAVLPSSMITPVAGDDVDYVHNLDAPDSVATNTSMTVTWDYYRPENTGTKTNFDFYIIIPGESENNPRVEKLSETKTAEAGEHITFTEAVTVDFEPGEYQLEIYYGWNYDPSSGPDGLPELSKTIDVVIPETSLSIDSLTVPESTITGTTATFSATVTNDGQNATTGVDFAIGGQTYSAANTTIGYQESATFSVSPTLSLSPGTYQVTATVTANESVTATDSIEILAQEPDWSITALDVPATGVEGESVGIDVSVANDGTWEGSTAVSVSIGDATTQTDSKTIDNGSTATFSVSPTLSLSPGTYQVTATVTANESVTATDSIEIIDEYGITQLVHPSTALTNTSVPIAVTAENRASSPISLSASITVNGEVMQLDGSSERSIQPGQTTTWTVSWEPTVANLGANAVTATVGDASASGTIDVSLPSIAIRNERTGELINSSTIELELRFYEEGSQTVLTRTTADGIVDLGGVDPEQRVLVQASAAPVNASNASRSYVSRTVLLESLIDQQSIYLLPTTTATGEPIETVTVQFSIADRTGQFPASDTAIFVERAINVSAGANTTTFERIVGDIGGPQGGITTVLERDVRYRVGVHSPAGDVRRFGGFVATASDTVQLEIGEIRLLPESNAPEFEATLADGNVTWAFASPSPVYSLEVTIVEQFNDSNIGYQATFTGVRSVRETVTGLPNATNGWIVEAEIAPDVEAIAANETIVERRTLGAVGGIALPMAGHWVATFGMIGIILVAGLLGGAAAATGAIVTVMVAWGLVMFEIVAIPEAFLLGAAAIAMAYKVGGR